MVLKIGWLLANGSLGTAGMGMEKVLILQLVGAKRATHIIITFNDML